jgi:hypothetical protein
MLSRLDDSHERSIAPVELRYNEMLLRLVAGHTTPHCRIIRNLVDRSAVSIPLIRVPTISRSTMLPAPR